MVMRSSLAIVSLLTSVINGAEVLPEPNPPTWPRSVTVFHPSDSTATIEQIVQAAYIENGGREDNGQFSADHFAFLFMPDYTQVLGLGQAPTEVVFDGDKGVYCEEGDYDFDIGALDTFWRSAENFYTMATHQWTDMQGMLWAVSQASPLRRILVEHNLKLFEYRGGSSAGYASGGFLANSVVRGTVASGSQQQWLTRSSHINKWVEGVWNMVFVGVDGAPTPHCGQNIELCSMPYVVVETAPLVAEKPFISAVAAGKYPGIMSTCQEQLEYLCGGAKSSSTGDCLVCGAHHQQQIHQAQCSDSNLDTFCTTGPVEHDTYSLHIPQPRRDVVGPDIRGFGTINEEWATGTTIDFSRVFVADPARDTAASINLKLAQGLHVVLSPGDYELEDTLRIETTNQVLLGLGLPTLIPIAGTAAVTVSSNAKGVRVAGLLLQAGTVNSPALLQWGQESEDGNGHRILSESECNLMQTRIETINNICCGDDDANCNGGTPSSCDAGCAAVFLPFYTDCHDDFPKDFDRVVEMCEETVSNTISIPDTDFGFIFDIFARVGGPRLPEGEQARVDSMVRIESSAVVGDCLWLWRADHEQGGNLVRNGDNPCNHGIVVNGDDVIIYGLAAEHTLQDIVQWNGDRGETFFFQAELPYDVDSYPYAGYAVGPSVQSHRSVGAGVYHFFRDHAVTVQAGITCPPALEGSFFDPLGVFLNGHGTMLNIINDKGGATRQPSGPGADPKWICGAASATATEGGRRLLLSMQSSANTTKGLSATSKQRLLTETPSCEIGASVLCPGNGPGGAQCAGNECCAGGVTCPSAAPNFACCPAPKTVDCTNGLIPPPSPPSPPGPVTLTPPPPPSGPDTPESCRVGENVACPGGGSFCAGLQCCMDGSTCPSADSTFSGCPLPKAADCITH